MTYQGDRVETILIALNGSELSEMVLRVALTIARKCEYQPILLSVRTNVADHPLGATQ